MSKVFFAFLVLMGNIYQLSAYELAIGSLFRNEAPYLKEWVDYHYMAGVEHFWLYNDNSTDNWQEVLKPYIEKGIVEVFYSPTPAGSSYTPNQVNSFKDAIKRGQGNTKWVALIDVDEFLVPMHNRSIPECLNNHFSSASAIYVNWRNFGTGGVYIPQGEPILFKLTAASLPTHSDNAVGKSIVRPESIDLENAWCPHHFPLKPDAYYVNGSHNFMPFRGTDLPTDGNHHGEHIRINHYVLRDEGFYQNVRLARANQGYGNKNLLLEHYDSFSKVQDYAIIDFIQKHQSKVDKPYVIGAILGQLGNQMFQVATTCALAWDHDAEPYFPDFAPVAHYPEGSYKHVFFRCNISPPSEEISSQWGAPPFGYFSIPFQSKMRISGYFLNEKYFAHHRDRLLKLFAPHPNDLEYIQNKYGWILNHPNTVSVHLRYYYAEKPDEDCFIQYDWEYFGKAMALFPDSSLFVVTSDNLNFARQNIPTEGKNVIFIEGEQPHIDFYLQSMCKSNIICNSTFSWWSAWLNQNPNKTVVRPAVWMESYPDIGGPEEWIKVDAQGMQARLKQANK